MPQNQGFYGLGIAPNILAVLDKLQFTVPTPIQEKAIPPAIEGKDREIVLNYLEAAYPPRAQERGGWQNPFLNR